MQLNPMMYPNAPHALAPQQPEEWARHPHHVGLELQFPGQSSGVCPNPPRGMFNQNGAFVFPSSAPPPSHPLVHISPTSLEQPLFGASEQAATSVPGISVSRPAPQPAIGPSCSHHELHPSMAPTVGRMPPSLANIAPIYHLPAFNTSGMNLLRGINVVSAGQVQPGTWVHPQPWNVQVLPSAHTANAPNVNGALNFVSPVPSQQQFFIPEAPQQQPLQQLHPPPSQPVLSKCRIIWLQHEDLPPHVQQLYATLSQNTQAHDSIHQSDPGSVDITETLLSQADILRVRQRYEEAIESYHEILQQRPIHVIALNSQGGCLRHTAKLDLAKRCFEAVLALHPANWAALNNMGVLALDCGSIAEAHDYCSQSLKLIDEQLVTTNCTSDRPDEKLKSKRGIIAENLTFILIEAAAQARAASNLTRSSSLLMQALALAPENPYVHFNLGQDACAANNLSAAMQAYERAVELAPNYAEAWCNLGVVCKARGELERSTRMYMKALQICPNFAIARSNAAIAYTDYGTLLKLEGKTQLAIQAYRTALSFNPYYHSAWYNLGVSYAETGQIDEAILAYELSTHFCPRSAEAYNNLGVLCKDRGNLERAVACYQRALEFNPKFVQAMNNLGVVYTLLGRWNEAYDMCVNAIKVDPTYSEAFNNLGVLFRDEGKIAEALLCYDHALEIQPNSVHAAQNRLLALNSLPETAIVPSTRPFDESDIMSYTTTHRVEADVLNPHSVIDFIAQEHARWGYYFVRSKYQKYYSILEKTDVPSPVEQGEQAVELLSLIEGLERPFDTFPILERERREHQMQAPSPSSFPNRPLRVGFLSADFFTHSVSYFVESLLAHADRNEIETFCYSAVSRADTKTELLKGLAHCWREIAHLSPIDLAHRIREDEIDILVELSGHTSGNRLELATLKPAPIIVTWLGYPNTTGLTSIDYRISDAIADPVTTTQKFTETLVRLPRCFLNFRPVSDPPAVGPLPFYSNKFFTFGSFNNLAKVTDEVIELWSAVLHSVPHSRLLLKCKPFASENVKKHVYEAFRKYGIDHRRVDCLPLRATTHEHLTAYNLVDLALDTFPYSGTTTTCESLLMGVPVITLRVPPPRACHAQNVSSTIIARLPQLELSGRAPIVNAQDSQSISQDETVTPVADETTHPSWFFPAELQPTVASALQDEFKLGEPNVVIPARDFVATTKSQFIKLVTYWTRNPDRLAVVRSKLRDMLEASEVCDGTDFARCFQDTLRSMYLHKLENKSNDTFHAPPRRPPPDVNPDQNLAPPVPSLLVSTSSPCSSFSSRIVSFPIPERLRATQSTPAFKFDFSSDVMTHVQSSEQETKNQSSFSSVNSSLKPAVSCKRILQLSLRLQTLPSIPGAPAFPAHQQTATPLGAGMSSGNSDASYSWSSESATHPSMCDRSGKMNEQEQNCKSQYNQQAHPNIGIAFQKRNTILSSSPRYVPPGTAPY